MSVIPPKSDVQVLVWYGTIEHSNHC